MNIVIVDDDINLRKSLEISLKEYDWINVKSYKNAKDALKGIDESCDLIITDVNMPGLSGIDMLRELNGRYEAIIITGYASLSLALDALRIGVKDFFIKSSLDIDSLLAAIKRVQTELNIKRNMIKGGGGVTKDEEGLAKKSRGAKAKTNDIHEGKNIKDILHLARRCAKTNANILLLGESGVGKEVFAKYIHSQSLRFKESFIAINMAAIPDNLLESELFGYEKGAFTDASTLKIGLFEKANLGTLFLDEITEMPLGLQAKLLRAIQEREIVRLGGLKSIPLNVRFISASNANIEDKIKANLFREDLFYRLQTIPIYIPPLRERLDEIPHLVKLKLALLEKEYDMSPKFFNQEALESLAKYSWPGNIRELFSVVERSFILSSTEEIGKKDLYLESRNILSKGSM